MFNNNVDRRRTAGNGDLQHGLAQACGYQAVPDTMRRGTKRGRSSHLAQRVAIFLRQELIGFAKVAAAVFMALVWLYAVPLSAATATSTSLEAEQPEKLISILEVAPQTYWGMIRYPKFYGDPHLDHRTIDGPVRYRQYLLGTLDGARERLFDKGVVLDAGLTQIVQGVASGDGDGATYFGSGDFWLGIDTGRAGLWSGGLFFVHAEVDWGNTVDGAGAVLPLNFDTTMPAAPSKFAISEFYLFQALPKQWAMVAGKVDWSAYADTNLFANNERNEFVYTGLVNNPILGSFVPYTSLGGALFKQINKEVQVGAVLTSNSTNALSVGFDDFSSEKMTLGLAANWTPSFNGKPGIYGALVGGSNKDLIAYDLNERYLIEELTGVIPIEEKSGNYAITFSASQYLCVTGAQRSDGQSVGFGPFFRFGVAPKDRNLFDQFYSLGIGGKGGFAGRVNDSWGIGWAGSHVSADLRRDAEELGLDVDRFEQGFEGFYNIALTPAVGLSITAQYLNSAAPGIDNPLLFATRLQLDF